MAKFKAEIDKGEERGGVAFTALETGAITGITKANPAVVTSASHGLSNGEQVMILGSDMTEVNGLVFTTASVATNTFQLSGVNSSAYAAVGTSGYWTRVDGQTTRPGMRLEVDMLQYTATEKVELLNDLERMKQRINEADWPPA